jgi:hypothetical protein
MIADSIILIALHYIDRGLKAKKKVVEIEGHHVDTHHKIDKQQPRHRRWHNVQHKSLVTNTVIVRLLMWIRNSISNN